MNFPANRPVMMASIQHTTFRMFHPRPGYLLKRKEKQLPTTIMRASVWLCETGSSAKMRKLKKVTRYATMSRDHGCWK